VIRRARISRYSARQELASLEVIARRRRCGWSAGQRMVQFCSAPPGKRSLGPFVGGTLSRRGRRRRTVGMTKKPEGGRLRVRGHWLEVQLGRHADSLQAVAKRALMQQAGAGAALVSREQPVPAQAIGWTASGTARPRHSASLCVLGVNRCARPGDVLLFPTPRRPQPWPPAANTTPLHPRPLPRPAPKPTYPSPPPCALLPTYPLASPTDPTT